MSDTVRANYLTMSMPHYIWVAEITTIDDYCREEPDDRKILGELILDSTSSKYDPRRCIAIHLPGYLFIRDHETGKLNKGEPIKDDGAYRHFNALC